MSGTLIMPSDDNLVRWYKNEVKNDLDDIIDTSNNYNNSNFRANKQNHATLKGLVDRIDIEDIRENFHIADNIFMIDTDGEDIAMQSISIRFMNPDCYKLSVKAIPITKFTLERLKGATKIYDAKEPKINPRINSSINIDEINSAKKLVLERKR